MPCYPESTEPVAMPALPLRGRFEDPFFADVAERLWADENCSSLQQAIEQTVEGLSHEDTLALATYIDLYEHRDSSKRVIEPITWEEPGDFTVDSDGAVRAIVGHTRTIKDTILNYGAMRFTDDADQGLLMRFLEANFWFDLYEVLAVQRGTIEAELCLATIHTILERRKTRSHRNDESSLTLFDV